MIAACDAPTSGSLDPWCLVAPEDDQRCDLGELADRFARCIRPRTGACASCHDATAPPALLKAPGPPWLDPDDSDATVRRVLELGLISARQPTLTSLFLLKPSGTVSHTGGVHFTLDGPDGAPWITFVEWAAPCVSSRR